RAFYSSTRGKLNRAVENGAVGMIGFSTTLDLERAPWERSVRNRANSGMRWVGPDGSVGHAPAQIQVSVHLGPAGATKLFEGADHSEEEVRSAAAEGRLLSFEMNRSVHFQKNVLQENVNSANVLAVLEGSDPQLKNEYVLFSAHLDHMGVGAEIDGDDLYNGAYDNAAGVAVLLELARVFAGAAERPKRSLLFVAVTAEEKGLLGADYFARNPTVPMDAVAANVNMDMPIFTFPMGGLVGFGAEHSSLEHNLKRAAEELGMVLEPDPFPEEVVFIRSDQFAFVQHGVPAVFLVPGHESSDPNIDGHAKWNEWLTTYYHKPTDDLSRAFIMESAYRFTAANYLIALDVANADSRPTWNEGDFFGDKFARK
ncbi:MAG: M20/M25/M40 family metallo-hydrolase, partial [Gammaproteobacteria bacterium]